MTNPKTKQETKTVNDVTRLYKQLESNIALVETARNALKDSRLEGTFDLDGNEVDFIGHIWTTDDRIKYGGRHEPKELSCYIMRKDRDSYKDITTVNGIGICEIRVTIVNNFVKDSVIVRGKRTGSRADVSDKADAKLKAKIQPIIDILLEVWNSESAKAKYLTYAELTKVVHALNQSRYEMNCVEAILRNKEIYFGLELAETLDKLTDVSGN